ncbi:probable serine/threonine-protein kinase qkgA [Ptychodera flava]|uniref:probable serine/threonine-protein kinase qkgA n=1 Tax=Ptychodera flava TaxID=63121 RepID=UPI00396A834B
MLVGAYGAGKTSTKRSLFNEPYIEQHLSTDGADIYDIDITEWIIKGFNTEYQGLKSIEETKKILGGVLAAEMVKKESAEGREMVEIATEKVVGLKEALKLEGENMKDVKERLALQMKEVDVDKPDIYFNLWDFAGQSVYYITHQVFLGNRVIFVLVTDLSKSLDDTMSTDAEDDGQLRVHFLSFWMNSIHTHALPGSNIQLKLPDGHNKETPAPPVILLGTKKDLLRKSNSPPVARAQDEDVEKEAVERLAEIVDYLGRNATQAVNAHRVGMMAIDNKSRRQDGTVPAKDVEKLRKMIQKYAMEYFCLGEVPVKWIRLELSLRTKQQKTINLKEVEKIGKKLEMTNNEILEALAFYHSVGEILYFTTVPELKDTVILDVRWLVDLFTILINQSMTCKQQLGDVDWRMRSLIAELHKEGRLHEELLDYLLKDHDRFQDKAILLALSEMYDILFRMPETDGDKPVYYLPSLLQKDAAGKNGIVCPADSKSCDPIYFHFQGNFLPEGIFYRLVVRCLKQWPNRDMVLRKHKARIFMEKHNFHITLCKEGSDIELKALIMSESKYSTEFQPVLLSNMRSVVENELKKLIETYTPNLKYQVCIKCRCPNHHPGELLRGAEDTDDRCVAIKVEKGKAKAICGSSNKLLLHPDLKFWYCAGNIPEVQAPVDLPEARRDQKATLSPLRKYFLHLSENLGKKDEKTLLYLLKGDKIPKREAENMSSAMDILCFLEDAGYISIDNTTLLMELLESLKRKSLVDDMKKFLG